MSPPRPSTRDVELPRDYELVNVQGTKAHLESPKKSRSRSRDRRQALGHSPSGSLGKSPSGSQGRSPSGLAGRKSPSLKGRRSASPSGRVTPADRRGQLCDLRNASSYSPMGSTERQEAQRQWEGIDPSTVVFWRRAWFQIVLFTLISILVIGPYNGLNALGGGGLSDHLIATKMNTVYACSLALLGWIGGALFNAYGCRKVCVVAALCYSMYVGVIVSVSEYGFPSYVVYPAGCIMGLGASLMWASFGVVSIRYPTLRHQGRVFSILWGFLNLGGLLTGLTQLVISYSEQQPTADASGLSYLVFLLLMMTGAILSAVGLRHQDQVVRSDGAVCGTSQPLTRPSQGAGETRQRIAVDDSSDSCRAGSAEMLAPSSCSGRRAFWIAETTHTGHPAENPVNLEPVGLRSTLGRAFCQLMDSEVMPLWPAFCAAFAHMPFLFNGLNSNFFNLRTRAFNSSVYWGSRIAGGFLFHAVSRQSRAERSDASLAEIRKCFARRLMPGFYLTFTWAALSLLLSRLVIFDTFHLTSFDDSQFDFIHDFPVALFPMFCFLAFGILDALVQSLMYGLMASMSGDNARQAALRAGLYKSLQSLAVGILWGVDWILSSKDFDAPPRYRIQWWIVAGVWTGAFPGTLWKLLQIRKMPLKSRKEDCCTNICSSILSPRSSAMMRTPKSIPSMV